MSLEKEIELFLEKLAKYRENLEEVWKGGKSESIIDIREVGHNFSVTRDLDLLTDYDELSMRQELDKIGYVQTALTNLLDEWRKKEEEKKKPTKK